MGIYSFRDLRYNLLTFLGRWFDSWRLGVITLIVVAPGQTPGIVERSGRKVLLVPRRAVAERLEAQKAIRLHPGCQWAEAVKAETASLEPQEPWPLLESD